MILMAFLSLFQINPSIFVANGLLLSPAVALTKSYIDSILSVILFLFLF